MFQHYVGLCPQATLMFVLQGGYTTCRLAALANADLFLGLRWFSIDRLAHVSAQIYLLAVTKGAQATRQAHSEFGLAAQTERFVNPVLSVTTTLQALSV